MCLYVLFLSLFLTSLSLRTSARSASAAANGSLCIFLSLVEIDRKIDRYICDCLFMFIHMSRFVSAHLSEVSVGGHKGNLVYMCISIRV